MNAVFQDFENRVREVNKFFSLLKILEDPSLVLSFTAKKTHKHKKIDPEWPSILRASAFLILYNLVEGAIREGFGAVYEKIAIEGLSIDLLRSEFRSLWIDQRHRALDGFSASQKTFQDKAGELVNEVIDKTIVQMDGRRLPVSGNLDGPAVMDVCKRHGMVYKIHRAAQGGYRLEVVRKQRNALAHGNVSFVSCGRDYGTADLEAMKDQAIIFVRSVLNNLKRYSGGKKYAV